MTLPTTCLLYTSSEGVLSVGQNAVIRAEINTKSVIIHGKVIGNVTVTDLSLIHI